MECSVCHTRLPENARFCFSCGAPVGGLHPRLIRRFFEAVEAGQLEIAEEMLAEVPSLVNARLNTEERETPLHRVAVSEQENAVEMLRLLLDFGADVNARETSGDTPLNDAFLRGSRTVRDALIEYGGRYVISSSGLTEWLFFMTPVREGDVDEIGNLIDLIGADPTTHPGNDESWLSQAKRSYEEAEERFRRLPDLDTEEGMRAAFEQEISFEEWSGREKESRKWRRICQLLERAEQSPSHNLHRLVIKEAETGKPTEDNEQMP